MSYQVIKSDNVPEHGEGVIWVKPTGEIRVSAGHLGWRLPNAREIEEVKSDLKLFEAVAPEEKPAETEGVTGGQEPLTEEDIAKLNESRQLDDGKGAPTE